MRDKIILPNSFLKIAEEELKEGKSVRLLADGYSMYPFILGGEDEVEISPFNKNDELNIFSCYMFKWQDKYIIHRLIRINDKELVFQGDRNGRKKLETVNRSDVIGVLSRIYTKKGKEIDCSSPTWINKGKYWYRLRFLRRILTGVLHRSHLR